MQKFGRYKLVLFVIFIAVIVVLFERLHLYLYLNLDGFNQYHQQVLAYEEENTLVFIIGYIISYIVLIAACIPGTILFDLLAGFLFGPVAGSFIVIGSYLSGAVVNFLLVKFFFKEFLTHKFGHLRHVVDKGGDSRAMSLNLIGLRFIPVIPFWLLNILAAILNIRLQTFIFTTFIGIIPTSIIYVLIGHGVRTSINDNHPLTMSTISNPELWAPLIMLGLIILIPNIIRNIRKRKQNAALDNRGDSN